MASSSIGAPALTHAQEHSSLSCCDQYSVKSQMAGPISRCFLKSSSAPFIPAPPRKIATAAQTHAPLRVDDSDGLQNREGSNSLVIADSRKDQSLLNKGFPATHRLPVVPRIHQRRHLQNRT